MVIDILTVILILALGFTFGFYVCRVVSPKPKNGPFVGTMVVNTTDIEKDVCRLEIDIPIADMMNRETITFKVRREDTE